MSRIWTQNDRPKVQAAGAYTSFHSMKHVEKYCYSPPPGWNPSPWQGYPQQYVAGTHLYSWVTRNKVELSSLSKETM